MGDYPITQEEIRFVDSMMAFTAFDENGPVGFFTLRHPGETLDELRMGFVVVDSKQRGTGKGKEMLKLGLKYAFDVYGAKKVTLGVFENNESAHQCYRKAGFADQEIVCAEPWNIIEMAVERNPQ